MVNFRRIPNIFITRPMAFVLRSFFNKPFTMPDGDKRNKDTIYYPKDVKTIFEKDLSLNDVYKHTPHISTKFRGLLGLNIMKCTGCTACARVCPNKCIEMKIVDPQPLHWTKKKKLQFPQMYTGRCMYCGFCEEACPYDCLFHTQLFDGASTRNEELHHDDQQLYKIYQKGFPDRFEKELQEYIEEWGRPVEENVGPLEEATKKSVEEGVIDKTELMED